MKRKPQPTPINQARTRRLKRLIRRIERVANEMRQLGVEMDYFGGFSEMAEHGREMIGASLVAKGWANEIEATWADEIEATLHKL